MIWIFWMPHGKKDIYVSPPFLLIFLLFSVTESQKKWIFQVLVTGKLLFSFLSGFFPCFCQNFLCRHYIHQETYPCPKLSICKMRIETLASLLVKFSLLWRCFKNLEGRWNSCTNDMFWIYINSEIYPIWLGWQCQKLSSKGNKNNCHW